MSDMDELQRALGRVEGKLDTFIAQMATQDNRTTELEVRVRRTENKQYWLSGFGSMLGTLAGLFLGKPH